MVGIVLYLFVKVLVGTAGSSGSSFNRFFYPQLLATAVGS